MRIIFPSASIAAFTSSYLVSAAVVKAHDLAGEQRIEKVARGVDESFQSSNTRKRSLDEECNTFKSGGDSAEENAESGLTDVGILAGCGPKQTCEPDGSSLLGGRCTMSNVSAQLKLPSKPVSMAAFPKRRGRRTNQIQRALRFLQETDATTDDAEEEQVCPPNCPQQFCDCAFDDGDANKCAYELHSVCINDLLDKCVPDSSMSFYTDTYCPFAECIALEGKSYEECTCAYYANYCNVYYAYLESIEKCAVSNCCDGQPDGMKYTCIPALQPTGNPTMAPIFSPHPSSSPTVSYGVLFHLSFIPFHDFSCVHIDILCSHLLVYNLIQISSMPTISSAPTVSPVPTVTPTITPKPTVSMAPNSLSPTEPPTTSTAVRLMHFVVESMSVMTCCVDNRITLIYCFVAFSAILCLSHGDRSSNRIACTHRFPHGHRSTHHFVNAQYATTRRH